MGSLKRKSRESDSVEDVRLNRRLRRRCMASSGGKVYPTKSGVNNGGSSAKAPTRGGGSLPTKGAATNDHFPPDDDYVTFLNGLGLGLPPAADSADRGVGANRRSRDAEAATPIVGSGLMEDCPEDFDIDIFKFLSEKGGGGGGGGSSVRAENNGVGDDGNAETSDDDKPVDRVHVVEEAGDVEGCANNGDGDGSSGNAAVAEDITDHCNNVCSEPSDRDQRADNDVAETCDPVYGRFLENMREDGVSCSVELPVSSGQSLFIVYDKQDVSRGEFDGGEIRPTSLQRKDREPEIRIVEGCSEARRDCQRRDEGDTVCDPRVPSGSNKSSLIERKFSYKTEKGVCSGFRREESSQKEDLLQKRESKKEKEGSDSKVASSRERKSRSLMRRWIRDGMGDAPENVCRTEAPMPASVQPKTGDTRTKKVPAPNLARERITESMLSPSEQKGVSSMQDRKRKRWIPEETQKKMPANNNQYCRPKIERVENDKCYEAFLSSLEMKPMHVEFVPSVGEKVLYHDYPSSSSDSDVIEIDAATFANDVNTPFVPTKNHEFIDLELEPEEGCGRNYYNSAFKVKLLEILRKPYDQKEYQELLKEVSCGKQLVKDRELRHGRTVSVKLKSLGPSYLDNHKDFASKLHELKPHSESNLPVRLNLLRGFVYWLENIPLPGSFKPWMDESCLKVLPSCKRVPWN